MKVRPNTTLRALREGRIVLCGESYEGWPPTALTYAAYSMDCIWIDTEHTCLDLGPVATMIQTSRLAGITPIVRVTSPEYHLINRLLDNGVQGFIVPRVRDPETVERVISYCQFPPKGVRGCGIPFFANDFRDISVGEYVAEAYEEILVSVQAETREAVEAIDEIASVPGLHLVIIGPNDLSIAHGVPGQIDHPLVIERIERVIEACVPRGVAVGIAGAPNIAFWAKKGMRFFACINDAALFQQACRERLEEIRRSLAEEVPEVAVGAAR